MASDDSWRAYLDARASMTIEISALWEDDAEELARIAGYGPGRYIVRDGLTCLHADFVSAFEASTGEISIEAQKAARFALDASGFCPGCDRVRGARDRDGALIVRPIPR